MTADNDKHPEEPCAGEAHLFGNVAHSEMKRGHAGQRRVNQNVCWNTKNGICKGMI